MKKRKKMQLLGMNVIIVVQKITGKKLKSE